MASSSLQSRLRAREKMVHVSKDVIPVASLGLPEGNRPRVRNVKPGFRQKSCAATKDREFILHPRGNTRSGQRAAKDWLRQKTIELKQFIKDCEANPNTTRASFHYVEGPTNLAADADLDEAPVDPQWVVGLFKNDDEKPFHIIKAPSLVDALREIEGDYIALFQKEDMEREPKGQYPERRFIVNG